MKLKFCVAVLAAGMSVSVAAKEHMSSDGMQVGRYSEMNVGPRVEQVNVLKAIIQTRFHRSVTTVGQAIDYLLIRSGYRLTAHANPSMQILKSRPLPEVHRELGPMTLDDALRTLAGPIYRLVVDPLHRLVSFELKESYQALLNDYGRETQYSSEAPKHKVITSTKKATNPRMPYNVFEPNRYREAQIMDHTTNEKVVEPKKEVKVAKKVEPAHKPLIKETLLAKPVVADETVQIVEKVVQAPVHEDVVDVEVKEIVAVESVDSIDDEVVIVANKPVWLLAKDLAKEAGITRAQAAVAIFEANRTKFGRIHGDHNINSIVKGTELQVPDFQAVQILSDEDASDVIMLHDEDWQTG